MPEAYLSSEPATASINRCSLRNCSINSIFTSDPKALRLPTHQGLEGPHAKSTSFLHRDLSHGKMRHDLIVPRDRCGALIGPGGSVFKDMSARIGAGVHIFDRDLVPGEPEERRLVVVTGSPQQCMLAAAEVMLITSRPNDPNKVFTSGPLAGHRVQDQRPGQAGRLGLDFSPSAVLTIAAQPPPPPVPPPPPPEPAPDGAAAAPYGLPGLAPPGAPTFETSKHKSTGGFVFKRRLDQWPLPSAPNPAAALSGKHLFRLLEVRLPLELLLSYVAASRAQHSSTSAGTGGRRITHTHTHTHTHRERERDR